jgi:hypothetical protein
MNQTSFFSSTFKRQQTPDGSMLYIFLNNYTQNDKTHNEPIELAVQGAILYSETDQLNAKMQEEQCFTKLPEETQNPAVYKKVYETWLRDCSCAFVKPPTLEECLANTMSIWDSNAPVASLNPSEEDSDWILQWIPTRIHVHVPSFQIYWAPCYKLAYTRIPELHPTITPVTKNGGIHAPLEQIELQNPEKTYTITRLNEVKDHDWPQEMNDTLLPYSDLPPLRFDTNSEMQQEKYRRRVREARIRAKLARYRAERIAQRYEERYGVYPEEDEEEAQTEAEQTEEE